MLPWDSRGRPMGVRWVCSAPLRFPSECGRFPFESHGMETHGSPMGLSHYHRSPMELPLDSDGSHDSHRFIVLAHGNPVGSHRDPIIVDPTGLRWDLRVRTSCTHHPDFVGLGTRIILVVGFRRNRTERSTCQKPNPQNIEKISLSHQELLRALTRQ